jgi:hypothetical protein
MNSASTSVILLSLVSCVSSRAQQTDSLVVTPDSVATENGGHRDYKIRKGRTAAAGQSGAMSRPQDAPLIDESDRLHAPAGPYLGQREPGVQAEMFAPGVVSLPGRREGTAVFSPDGLIFYFTVVAADQSFATHEMHRRDTGWTSPRRAAFADLGNTSDAHFSPDGTTLYFSSTRPPGTPPWNHRTWTASRTADGWSEPRLLEVGVDTDKGIHFPTISRRGTLWVGTFADKSPLPNLGKGDLYYIETAAAKMLLQNPGIPINSPHEDWDPFVAPDESYLVFASDRPGGLGSIDIWISFRASDGSWGVPLNLGPDVNTSGVDVAGRVTPDGRFLFFERPTRTEQDIYWVSTEIISRLRPKTGSGSN